MRRVRNRWVRIRSGLMVLAAAAIAIPVGVLPADPASAADATRSAQWYLPYLKVGTAHKITQGRGVTVAVIDTGVFEHEDLKDRLLAGIDYTTPAGGNGHVDTDGHGTWIAGLIAAHGHGTGLGLLGIAPGAHILPIRVAPTRPNPSDGTVAKAILFAMKKGAKIIHLSAMAGDQATMDAVAKAVAAGVLVIAPTGNTQYDKQIPPPGSWPGVVVVSGVDAAGKLTALSVAGSKVEFSAPGADVITTDKVAGMYGKPISTSTASAIAAGVAALVWAKYPKLKVGQVLQAMRTGATDKGAKGRDSQYGFGIVNAANALAAAKVIASPSPSVSLSPSLSQSAPAKAASTEAAVAPPVTVSDQSTQSGTSVGTILAIAGGVIFLLVLATFTVFLLRRARGGSPGGPGADGPQPQPQPWAPQRLDLPQPVAALPSPPVLAALPSVPIPPSPPQVAPIPPIPPSPPQVAPDGPAPPPNRVPANPGALDQPTVATPQPRFAFPADPTVPDPSIYDTATFPLVDEEHSR